MANKPPPGKQPEDEGTDDLDNLLGDSPLEELNLESLLSNGDGDGSTSGSAGGSGDEITLDDGELDLLAESDEDTAPVASKPVAPRASASDESPEEVSADDILDLGFLDESGEETKEVAGPTPASRAPAEPAPAGDVLEEIDLFAEADALAGEPSKHAPEDSPGAARPESVSDEAAIVGAAAAGAAAGAAAAAASRKDDAGKDDKKKGSKGLGKFGKKGGKGKAGGKDEGDEETAGAAAKERAKPEKKAAAAKPKKERAPKPEKVLEPAAASTRGAVAFVCSECYEEFYLPATYAQDVLSCPECLHVGKKPDADFLRTVKLHKSGEHKAFLCALAAGAAAVLCLMLLLWFTSQAYVAVNKRPAEGLVYGLAGATGVSVLALFWMVSRYEKNRWEVYF